MKVLDRANSLICGHLRTLEADSLLQVPVGYSCICTVIYSAN